MREPNIVVVIVIRVILVFVGADAAVVFKGRAGKMRTEGTDAFRLRLLPSGSLPKEGLNETYGRCGHKARTRTFDKLTKDAIEAHQ